MRKFFTAAAGGLVALVGFAGAASASGTIDLLWANGSNTIQDVELSGLVVLNVRLTSGPAGSWGGSISVDYSNALSKVAVVSWANTPNVPTGVFPNQLSLATNTGSQIVGLNVACAPFFLQGTCLTAQGQTAQIGTITFRKSALGNGTFTFRPVFGPDDSILDGLGYGIPNASVTLNSATLINAPEPGAISLLVMALGGVALAGRGRRS
jgi:hypothetical protein